MRGREKLKAWRKSAGLTLEAAAARAGVDVSTWWQWEDGRKRPSIDKLPTIATLTSASEYAITLSDFTETPEDRKARQARKRGAA